MSKTLVEIAYGQSLNGLCLYAQVKEIATNLGTQAGSNFYPPEHFLCAIKLMLEDGDTLEGNTYTVIENSIMLSLHVTYSLMDFVGITEDRLELEDREACAFSVINGWSHSVQSITAMLAKCLDALTQLYPKAEVLDSAYKEIEPSVSILDLIESMGHLSAMTLQITQMIGAIGASLGAYKPRPLLDHASSALAYLISAVNERPSEPQEPKQIKQGKHKKVSK